MARSRFAHVLILFAASCQASRPVATGPAIDAAAASLPALQARLEIAANNLANAQTCGFKAMRVVTDDSSYREQFVGTDRQITARIGSGVRIARTIPDMSQGTAIQTSRSLDLMIEGKGFFAIRDERPEGGIVYTRAGLFTLNAGGEIVKSGRAEARLEPNICLPPDITQVSVAADGRVAVLRPGAVQPEEVGQIEVTLFVNPEGLKPIGGELYIETAESGPPLTGNPGSDGRGLIRQGMLEGSNVNVIAEQIDMARTRALFDAVSRYATGGDSVFVAAMPIR